MGCDCDASQMLVIVVIGAVIVKGWKGRDPRGRNNNERPENVVMGPVIVAPGTGACRDGRGRLGSCDCRLCVLVIVVMGAVIVVMVAVIVFCFCFFDC